MNPDDPVCLCFHVSRRKVLRFIQVERPRRPSQLSECFGAGTGCGWCRPYLERLLAEHGNAGSPEGPADAQPLPGLDEWTLEEYEAARARYRKSQPPPPAGPVPE